MSVATRQTQYEALVERELRRRRRIASFPLYGNWLAQASPEWRWDYAWLRYVQGFYDRVTSGEIKKLMIFAPPQHGKSHSGTIRYPVYCMERDPTTRCILAAHTQRLANKFSRYSKTIASRRLRLARDRKSVEEWETTDGGGVKAIGVGGSIAGHSADLAFIDDPVKSRQAANSLVVRDMTWDWFNDDIVTRVQADGAIIIQTTRWHEDDLAGRILASEDAPNWTVVCLRALAEADDPLGRPLGAALCPERYDRATLLNRQLTMRLGFEALYQQRPTFREGTLFKRPWFQFVESIPDTWRIIARVRRWDLAATDDDGDYTAGVLMAKTADGRFWVEDVQRFRLGPTERDARILLTANADAKRPGHPTVIGLEQEPGSGGKAQCHALVRMLAGHSVTFETSTGSKLIRAEPYASQLGGDNVRILRDTAVRRWNAAYISELVEFSSSKHDDQVDASSGAFNMLAAKRQSKSY